jgi:hypothetical protein
VRKIPRLPLAVLLLMLLLRLPIPASWADLAATPGVGALIAYKLIGGANYVETLLCDSVVGVTQCATVTAANAVKVDGSAATQPISAAALPLPAGAATAALQAGVSTAANQATQITQETATATGTGTPADAAWTSGSGTQIAILKSISTNVSAPIPSGTNVIGGVFGSPNVTPTDCSVAITTGGTAQNLPNLGLATIHGVTIANIDAAAGSGEPVWISLTTTAVAATIASYPLAPPAATTFAGNGSYSTPMGFGVNHAISVVAATTGHKISCTAW